MRPRRILVACLGSPNRSRLHPSADHTCRCSPMPRKLEPPAAGKADIALTLTRAAVAAVPGIGGPAAELMGLIRPPLERRLNDFLNDVADHLAALEAEQRLTRERLAQDEQFLDVGSKGSTVQSCITWTEGLL